MKHVFPLTIVLPQRAQSTDPIGDKWMSFLNDLILQRIADEMYSLVVLAHLSKQ